MARKIVLADASPLIGLARVGGLPWLRKLYLIPAARPVFARLSDEGFHLGADLLQGILIELGED